MNWDSGRHEAWEDARLSDYLDKIEDDKPEFVRNPITRMWRETDTGIFVGKSLRKYKEKRETEYHAANEKKDDETGEDEANHSHADSPSTGIVVTSVGGP